MAHNHKHTHNAVKNIKIAFFLNVFFTIIEFFGGYFTNSVAIMSDALHDLGDSFSLGLAWFLEKVSSRKRTYNFSYGFRRFSLLGAFINAIVLLAGSLFILTKAIPRIINPESTNAQGMLVLAIFGVIINGMAVLKTAKGKTMNEKIVSLHLLEDVFGWIAVLIISIVMIFTQLTILDPILSVVFTLYILWNVFKNFKTTVLLFLQATPENLNTKVIDSELMKETSILGTHDTHVWSLDGEKHILTTHVIIPKKTQRNNMIKIKCRLKKKLKNMGVDHCTLEIELEGESCEDYCT